MTERLDPILFKLYLYSNRLSPEEIDSAISEYRSVISQLTRRLILIWFRNRCMAVLFFVLYLFLAFSGLMFCIISKIDNTGFLWWIITGVIFGLVTWVVGSHPGINSISERLMDQENSLKSDRASCQGNLRALLQHKASR